MEALLYQRGRMRSGNRAAGGEERVTSSDLRPAGEATGFLRLGFGSREPAVGKRSRCWIKLGQVDKMAVLCSF